MHLIPCTRSHFGTLQAQLLVSRALSTVAAGEMNSPPPKRMRHEETAADLTAAIFGGPTPRTPPLATGASSSQACSSSTSQVAIVPKTPPLAFLPRTPPLATAPGTPPPRATAPTTLASASSSVMPVIPPVFVGTSSALLGHLGRFGLPALDVLRRNVPRTPPGPPYPTPRTPTGPPPIAPSQYAPHTPPGLAPATPPPLAFSNAPATQPSESIPTPSSSEPDDIADTANTL